jgi:hypothetical protein
MCVLLAKDDLRYIRLSSTSKCQKQSDCERAFFSRHFGPGPRM